MQCTHRSRSSQWMPNDCMRHSFVDFVQSTSRQAKCVVCTQCSQRAPWEGCVFITIHSRSNGFIMLLLLATVQWPPLCIFSLHKSLCLFRFLPGLCPEYVCIWKNHCWTSVSIFRAASGFKDSCEFAAVIIYWANTWECCNARNGVNKENNRWITDLILM